MIIVKLSGGMGNQLFQYAFGKSLSLRTNSILKLDISHLLNLDANSCFFMDRYVLAPFNINVQIATNIEIEYLKQNGKIITEKGLNNGLIGYYDTSTKSISNNSYCIGMWQSEKYFCEYADIIKNELTPRDTPNIQNQEILEEIISCNSVGIHFRIGGYSHVINNKTYIHAKTTNMLPFLYYEQAIEKIFKQHNNIKLFIFSDKIKWVQDNFPFKYPHQFVTVNSQYDTLDNHIFNRIDHEDLRLLSACKHNIIANSTFSWWGAWLNKNKNKIICASKYWHPKAGPELLPESWQLIDGGLPNAYKR